MASVFERLAREEAAVRADVAMLQEELEAARKRLDAAEERLHKLEITSETLESLPDEAADADDPDLPAAGDEADDLAEEPVGPGLAAGSQFTPVGPIDWNEGRRRMLSVLATAGRAMKVREIALAIGEDVTTPARVETTRGRLKRLAQEGQVVEGPTAWFTIAAAGEGVAAEA